MLHKKRRKDRDKIIVKMKTEKKMQCYICERPLKREHTLFCGQRCMQFHVIAGKRSREEMEKTDPKWREMLKAVARNPEAIRLFSVQDIINMSRTSRDFWEIFAQNNYVWYVMMKRYVEVDACNPNPKELYGKYFEQGLHLRYDQNYNYKALMMQELNRQLVTVEYEAPENCKFEFAEGHQTSISRYDIFTGRVNFQDIVPTGFYVNNGERLYTANSEEINVRFRVSVGPDGGGTNWLWEKLAPNDWAIASNVLQLLEMESQIELLQLQRVLIIIKMEIL